METKTTYVTKTDNCRVVRHRRRSRSSHARKHGFSC